MIVDYQPYPSGKNDQNLILNQDIDMHEPEINSALERTNNTGYVDQFYSGFYLYDGQGALGTIFLNVQRLCSVQMKEKDPNQKLNKKVEIFIEVQTRTKVSQSQLQKIYSLIEYQRQKQLQQNITQKTKTKTKIVNIKECTNFYIVVKRSKSQTVVHKKYFCPHIPQNSVIAILVDEIMQIQMQKQNRLNFKKLTNIHIEALFVCQIYRQKQKSTFFMLSEEFWNSIAYLKAYEQSLFTYLKQLFQYYLRNMDQNGQAYNFIVEKLNQNKVLDIILNSLSNITNKLQKPFQDQQNSQILNQLLDITKDYSYWDKKYQEQKQWQNKSIIQAVRQILQKKISKELQNIPLMTKKVKNNTSQNSLFGTLKILNADQKSMKCFFGEFKWKFNYLFDQKKKESCAISKIKKGFKSYRFLMSPELYVMEIQEIRNQNQNQCKIQCQQKSQYQQNIKFQKVQKVLKAFSDEDEEEFLQGQQNIQFQCKSNSFFQQTQTYTQTQTQKIPQISLEQKILQAVAQNQRIKKQERQNQIKAQIQKNGLKLLLPNNFQLYQQKKYKSNSRKEYKEVQEIQEKTMLEELDSIYEENFTYFYRQQKEKSQKQQQQQQQQISPDKNNIDIPSINLSAETQLSSSNKKLSEFEVNSKITCQKQNSDPFKHKDLNFSTAANFNLNFISKFKESQQSDTQNIKSTYKINQTQQKKSLPKQNQVQKNQIQENQERQKKKNQYKILKVLQRRKDQEKMKMIKSK